jgi:hypothetical protein
MAVASVSKITAASPTSFDAAIQEGLERANRTLRGIISLIPSFQTTSKSPLNDPHFETVSAKRAMSGNSR